MTRQTIDKLTALRTLWADYREAEEAAERLREAVDDEIRAVKPHATLEEIRAAIEGGLSVQRIQQITRVDG